jgi:hypothetical protein
MNILEMLLADDVGVMSLITIVVTIIITIGVIVIAMKKREK